MSDANHLPAHGGQLQAVAAHLGVAPASILDFSANINPDGPPASVLTALRDALADPLSLTLYPDLALKELRSSIASFHDIDPAAVIVANGFVPLLDAVVRSLLPKRCLLPLPAFSEYRRTLERCGVEVIADAVQAQDFLLTPSSMAVQNSTADSMLLANPQNPSGTLTPANTLRELRVNSPDALLLLDEAFIDYVPQESLAAEAPLHDNLVVFRSVTKFFAMPGLRVAYAIARPDHAAAIRQHLAPWPISNLADLAVRAALADNDYQDTSRALNVHRRQHLVEALAAIGIRCVPASANFLLLRLPRDAERVRADLLHHHRIHLRSCRNFEGLVGSYLRAAIRNETDNARLVHALSAVLSMD